MEPKAKTDASRKHKLERAAVAWRPSNEVPSDETLGAIFDRFLLRVQSDNLDAYHFNELLLRGIMGGGASSRKLDTGNQEEKKEEPKAEALPAAAEEAKPAAEEEKKPKVSRGFKF